MYRWALTVPGISAIARMLPQARFFAVQAASSGAEAATEASTEASIEPALMGPNQSQLENLSRANSINPEIKLFEVGPREGMQAGELKHLSLLNFMAYLEKLAGSGVFSSIETTAAVKIPQMDQHPEIIQQTMSGIARRFPDVEFPVLVPNSRGLDVAIGHGAENVAVFTAASDTFSRKNKRRSLSEDRASTSQLIKGATSKGVRAADAYISMIAHSEDGPTNPWLVADMAKQLLDSGARYISLGDTNGSASGDDIQRLLDVLIPYIGSAAPLRLHLHDTHGSAVKNARIASGYGVSNFDVATGGLGGCPFVPGATGNVDARTLMGAFPEDFSSADSARVKSVEDWLNAQKR